MGVTISPLTEEFAKELGLTKPEGALVGAVEAGTPAAKAGVQVQDVIQKVDEQPVKNFEDLIAIVSTKPIGKSVKLTIWRNKKTVNLWPVIKERP